MTPTLPLASGTPNGTGQPATAAPAASAPAAPTDFLSLLAQIVGPPAQQAMTPLAPNTVLGTPSSEADSETLETDGTEALAMLPISLPMFSTESKFATPLFNADTTAGAQVLGAKHGGAALDLQMLTEMIQSEQASTQESADGFDSFHLPTVSSETAHWTKATAADLLARPVHAPVGSAQWADEIGSRLTLMTEQGKSAASLRLSPEHLGPLEIRISMKDDQASVWFGAAHADTRAAIEHALPRLRELFEAQGMSLADAGVFHEAPREQPNANPAATFSPEAEAIGPGEVAPSVRVSVGLIDAYA